MSKYLLTRKQRTERANAALIRVARASQRIDLVDWLDDRGYEQAARELRTENADDPDCQALEAMK